MSDDGPMFEALRQQYERTGQGEWLIIAASSCLINDCPAPEWLKDAWRESLIRWHTWDARTLGDAFGVPDRPQDPRAFRKAERTASYAGMIYLEVQRARKIGRAVDQALFEEIAERFDFGATTVKDLYYLKQAEMHSLQQLRDR